MYPIYLIDEELMCGIIKYNNNKIYLVDLFDRDIVMNFNKKFIFNNENEIYPSYIINNKQISLLEFIYKYNFNTYSYYFINNNKFDLRKDNVNVFPTIFKQIYEQYKIIKFIDGHYLNIGKDANLKKNPIWKIKDDSKEYLIMYCEPGYFCKLCEQSYNKILEFEKNNNDHKKITWYRGQNGYIVCKLKYYIHQIIMDCYGNGRGTSIISVDHIDRDPLNNIIENLRIATRKEQEQNSKGIMDGTKRARKTSAKPLPDGITQDMMKKYVVYYEDYADKEKKRLRQYFKIEKHPKLNKIFIGNKSNKIPILEKLNQINKIVDDLEKEIYP